MLTTQHTSLNLQNMLTVQFWQALAPNLNIAKPDYHVVPTPIISDQQGEYLRRLLKHEGYMHGTLGEWHPPLIPLIETIQQLKSSGILPVFAFIYDEIWQLAYQLSSTISCLLGDEYWILPDFWAWHIDPQQTEAGWKPHRDKDYRALLPDGTPSSLSAWIPLTPATVLNGCMYVLPADRDPVYGTPDDQTWQINYPDIRALPAKPNDFLIWSQALLHWGSRSSPRAAGQPRISCAFEFQRRDIPAWNQPFITPNSFLTFNQRLQLIGKQILQYQHMYPLSDDLRQLAQLMVAIA